MSQLTSRRSRAACFGQATLFMPAILWMVLVDDSRLWAESSEAKGTPPTISGGDTPATILTEAIAAARQIDNANSKASALYEIAQAAGRTAHEGSS